MTGLFSTPKLPKPLVTAGATPSLTDANVASAGAASDFAAALARGRASTLLTSGQGVPGAADVKKKTLGG